MTETAKEEHLQVITTLKARLDALDSALPARPDHLKTFVSGQLVYSQYKNEFLVKSFDGIELELLHPKAGLCSTYVYSHDTDSFRLKHGNNQMLLHERFYHNTISAEKAFKRMYTTFDLRSILRKVDHLIKTIA